MRDFVVIAFIMVILLLQVYLSRAVSRWPGLVLPIITGLFSLIYPLSYAVSPTGQVTASFIGQLLLIILIANIPTAILLAIYFTGRKNPRIKKQMNKMNIQDLD